MVEYVYHVDEDDNVIGKVTRKEMRDKNLLHRVVSIFIINSKGEILVHKRTDTKDVYPGYHDLVVSGTMEFGEEPDRCARREVMEEIGAQDFELQYLFKHKYQDEQAKSIIFVYKSDYGGPIKIQEEELVWAKFMTVSQIRKLAQTERFCPDNFEIFEKYLRENG